MKRRKLHTRKRLSRGNSLRTEGGVPKKDYSIAFYVREGKRQKFMVGDEVYSRFDRIRGIVKKAEWSHGNDSWVYLVDRTKPGYDGAMGLISVHQSNLKLAPLKVKITKLRKM